MNVGGTSDLGRLQAMQKRTTSVQHSLDKAGLEMTTGRKLDVLEATGGNLTRLYAIERSLARNEAYTRSATLTELRIDTMQHSLGNILDRSDDLAVQLVSDVNLGAHASAFLHAQTARTTFSDSVGQLNSQVAGQSLFAGTGTDGPALVAGDAILADLDALVAAELTGAGVIAAIEDYFRKMPLPAGAFHTTGYLGTTDDVVAAEIGEGVQIDYAVRADDDRLVAMLQAQALAAVVAGGALPGDDAERMVVLGAAGDQMLAAKEGLLNIRSHLGSDQEAIETAQAALLAEEETLSLARQEIVGADIAKAASYYQAIEAQLEAMYAVTARLAGISFTNYLR